MASSAAALKISTSLTTLLRSSKSHQDIVCKGIAPPLCARASNQTRIADIQTAVEKKGWKMAPLEKKRISRSSASDSPNRGVQCQVGVASETLQSVEAVTAENGKVSEEVV
jgi:hypothetical protein